MKGKKILGGVLLGILAVVLAAGILKVTGILKNSEADALALLAQLPDKISKSYEDEFLGTEAFEEKSREKGSVTSIKLANVKVNKEVADNMSSIIPSVGNAALFLNTFRDCTCSVDIASDEQQGLRKVSGTLYKGDTKLQAEVYAEGDTLQYVLPEILPGKVISQENNVMGNKKKEQLQKEFTEFLLNEYDKTKDDISCRKSRETTESYEFIISSSTLSIWVQDFVEFLKAENEIAAITNYIGKLNGQGGEYDGVSALEDLAEQLSKESAEYRLCVRGSEGELTSVSFGTKAEEAAFPAELTVSVSEEENASTVKLIYERKGADGNSRWEITRRNGKSDVYENEFDVVIRTNQTSIAVNTMQVVNPSDHSYNAETTIKWHGTKVADIVVDGSVKDIVEGESIHYILDDVTVSVGDKEFLTMAVDVQNKLLDYKLEKPEGEEVKSTEITDVMKQEIAANTTKKFLEFEFNKAFLGNVLSKVLQ